MISVLSSRVVTDFLKPHKASVMLMLNFMIRSVKVNYFKKPRIFLRSNCTNTSINSKFPPILFRMSLLFKLFKQTIWRKTLKLQVFLQTRTRGLKISHFHMKTAPGLSWVSNVW